MEKRFQKALITGASSGIGRQLSLFFAAKGIDLILVARTTEKLKELAEEIGSKVHVEILTADLADRSQRTQVIDKIYESTPDLVINNAGWGYYGEVLTHPTSDSMNVLEVDVVALMELSIEAARAMAAKRLEGVVMNVSSAAALQTVFPCFSVYTASKAFVNVFSESFDREMEPYGIRILACCPGMVDTGFRTRASGGAKADAHPQSMHVSFAVNEIWEQIQQGRPIHIFDWKYRFATFLTRYILPKSFVIKAVTKALAARYKKRDFILHRDRD